MIYLMRVTSRYEGFNLIEPWDGEKASCSLCKYYSYSGHADLSNSQDQSMSSNKSGLFYWGLAKNKSTSSIHVSEE